MSGISMVVPAGVTDGAHPSGGNRYDVRLADGLAAVGRRIRMVEVGGDAGPPLATALAGVPDGEPVLIDGLVATAEPGTVEAETSRLPVVVLLHMPPRDDDLIGVAALLERARGVITTSDWTRRQLLDTLPFQTRPSITVARPGVDHALPVARTAAGTRLRCIGAVLPHKGQDVLLAALGRLRELGWVCELVGATDLDPGFAARLQRQAAGLGIADRVRFAGARSPRSIRELYDGADLLVLPSRSESYGMVATEAIACGLPVLASDVGGVREALGTADGRVPGVLVRPDDASALAQALRDWLTRPDLRAALAAAVLARRPRLGSWTATARTVSAVLAAAADEPSRAPSRCLEESKETG